jgi:DNA-directed RNA polymerase subunit N (RpoN/RPB10)
MVICWSCGKLFAEVTENYLLNGYLLKLRKIICWSYGKLFAEVFHKSKSFVKRIFTFFRSTNEIIKERNNEFGRIEISACQKFSMAQENEINTRSYILVFHIDLRGLKLRSIKNSIFFYLRKKFSANNNSAHRVSANWRFAHYCQNKIYICCFSCGNIIWGWKIYAKNFLAEMEFCKTSPWTGTSGPRPWRPSATRAATRSFATSCPFAPWRRKNRPRAVSLGFGLEQGDRMV